MPHSYVTWCMYNRMKADSPAMHSKLLRVGQCVVAIDGKPLLHIRNARDLAELTQVVALIYVRHDVLICAT